MQRKKTDRRVAVLEAATILFSEKSFHDVKLDEVAVAADVGKGTIYTYFRSKEELFVQCLVHDAPVYEERVEKVIAADLSFEDGLKQLIALQAEYVERKGPLVKQFMALGPQLKLNDSQFKHLTSLFEKAVARLAGFFDRWRKQGSLTDRFTSGQMALMFQGLFDLNVAMSYFREPTLRSEDVFACVVKVMSREGGK